MFIFVVKYWAGKPARDKKNERLEPKDSRDELIKSVSGTA